MGEYPSTICGNSALLYEDVTASPEGAKQSPPYNKGIASESPSTALGEH